LVVTVRVRVCSTVKLGKVRVKLGFGVVKLGAVCVYPYPYIQVVVCRGIPRLGSEPSIVVWLWKWFTSWVEGIGIVVPPTDAPCGLV
jgi:hypothetical protein